MKNFKLAAMFLFIITTACSNFPKVDKGINIFNFNKSDVSLEIEILLPEAYESSGTKAYPVLYLLDGYWYKDSIKGAYGNLRFDNMVPEIIIVSVSYPKHIKNVVAQRMQDLTPAYDSGFKFGGNASVMLDVITQQVIPFVERNYRIDKERVILTGHSLAGLFTLYSMYQTPKAFTHYAAISPSALWANETLSHIDLEYSKKTNALRTNLYITYGTDEYIPYVNSLKSYISQLEGRNYVGLNLTLSKVEGLRHAGMTSEGFLRGIVWSLFDIRLKGPSGFENLNVDALK